jgi:hypothetical protein
MIYVPIPRLWRNGPVIDGYWRGWAIYVPVDGFFFSDREAIYRTEARFHQWRRRILMKEQLTEIFDLAGRPLTHIQQREIVGAGELTAQGELDVRFREERAPVRGVIMAQLDQEETELRGLIAVRPRAGARPVAVKLLLRRASSPFPTLDELDVENIRRIAPH